MIEIFGELHLTPTETAAKLRVHVNTVRNWLRESKFPNAFQTASGRWRIPECDLDGWRMPEEKRSTTNATKETNATKTTKTTTTLR